MPDDPSVNAAVAHLRAAGDRVTTPRKAVLGVLADGREHLTADEVFRAIAADAGTVHVSTVYRTLDSLVSRGLVTQVSVGHGPSVYHLSEQMTGHPHIHGQCHQCRCFVDLPHDLLDDVRRRADVERGFLLEDGPVALLGLCGACRQGTS